MSKPVCLSKDGSHIQFTKMEPVPTSTKKLRHSPEIKALYQFILEHNLQKESYDILTDISKERKAASSKA